MPAIAHASSRPAGPPRRCISNTYKSLRILPANRLPRRLLQQGYAQQQRHDFHNTHADTRQAPELASAGEAGRIGHGREPGRGASALAASHRRKPPGHDAAADHGRRFDCVSDHRYCAAGAAAARAPGAWSRHLRGRPRHRQPVRGVALFADVVRPIRGYAGRQTRGRRRLADCGGGRAPLSLIAPLRRCTPDVRHDTSVRPRASRCGGKLHHHGCVQLGTGSRRSGERRTSHSLGWDGDVRRPCIRCAGRYRALCDRWLCRRRPGHDADSAHDDIARCSAASCPAAAW